MKPVSIKPEIIGNRPVTYNQVLTVIVACICMLVAIFMSAPFNDESSMLTTGVILSIYSFYGFFYCGRKIVNAASVASYGTLMFIGFPSVYGALGQYSSMKAHTPLSLNIVILLAFVFQSAIMLTTKKTPHSRILNIPRLCFVSSSSAVKSLSRVSVIMLASAVLAHALGVSIAATGFSWISILSAAILTFCTRKCALIARGLAIMVSSFVIVNGLSLGGFGRLNLAVLAFSVVVIASVGLSSWSVKIVTILMTGPVLGFLVNQRMEFLQGERQGVVGDSEGIGSVVGPFHSAGTIVEAVQQGSVSLAWGATLFAAALIWIPRMIWPDKPVGFGREIVEVTQPWLLSSESFSDAGTFIGEAVWNFGVWGAPIYLILLVFIIKFLDQNFHTLLSREPDYVNLVTFIIIALLAGSLLNVIWGSFSTAAARTLFPAAVLLALWFVGKNQLRDRADRDHGRR